MAWAINQQTALAIAPKITGTLSIMGSVFIITDILKSKEKMGRTYSRILLVMSTYDFFTSIAQGCSTWPIPEGTAGVQFASGTTFSCTFQGFFTQLGVGAPMYNCSLSFYYLIVIAFAFSEERVKQFEILMHLIPLSFSFGSAIAGIPLTLYNSAGLWCWIAALPGSCQNGNNKGGEGECIRGENAWVYRWAIYYGPVWFCVLTITFNMTVVSYLVWAKERASLKFRFGHRSNVSSTASALGESTAFDGMDANAKAKAKAGRLAQYFAKKKEKKQKQKERQGLASQVFWQAFYYVLGFYITWIFPTYLRMLQTIGKPVPYWIVISMAILLPLQGFFNFLVYVRPRVVQYHNRHPEKSICSAMTRAVKRTVNVLYVSESRAFNETELQDIEALDPCYALQVENEQKAEEEKERRRSEDLKAAKHTIGEEGSAFAEEEKQEDATGNYKVEKSPLARDSMSKRRIDEMKLLSQDDPSFYEGNSSRRDYMMNLNDEKDASSSEGDVYMDEDQEQSKKEQKARAPEQAMRQPSISSTGSKRISDGEELEELLKEPGGESKEGEPSQYPPLKSTQLYFYPEFSYDPDFYFT